MQYDSVLNGRVSGFCISKDGSYFSRDQNGSTLKPSVHSPALPCHTTLLLQRLTPILRSSGPLYAIVLLCDGSMKR